MPPAPKKRNISPEERLARSERMKTMLANKRAERGPVDVAELSQEPISAISLAKALHIAVPKENLRKMTWDIHIDVDWNGLPLLTAQQAYEQLQQHYQKAGSILNVRSNERGNKFSCFICHTEHDRPARYVNNAYKRPGSDLVTKVECCGERCSVIFEEKLITERRDKYIAERTAHGS